MTKNFPDEGDVKKGVKRLLDRHGWFWFMPAANQFGVNGVSDILAMRKGLLLAVETKQRKGTGSVLQERFGKEIIKHGGEYKVVNQMMLDDGTFERYLHDLELTFSK